MEEVTAAIDTLQAKKESKKEVCVQHDSTPMNYYCNTCKQAICSDCAMFGDEHKQHQFERLQVVYQRHVDTIKQESGCLMRRLQELSEHVRETQAAIEKVTKAKEEKSKELELFVEAAQNKLNQQLKAKLLTLLQHKSAMTDEIESLDAFHSQLNKYLIPSNFTLET